YVRVRPAIVLISLSFVLRFFLFFFFFFQAEDGIRDLTVTGVQTCALPIFEILPHRGRRAGSRGRSGGRRHVEWNFTCWCWLSTRSEERRVGKECRSRGARYHEKEKEKRRVRQRDGGGEYESGVRELRAVLR